MKLFANFEKEMAAGIHLFTEKDGVAKSYQALIFRKYIRSIIVQHFIIYNMIPYISKRCFTLVSLLAVAVMTYAQPYSIKRLGIEDGLSSNYVVSITQDPYGFLWFATESGLNRFDGKNFRVYKKFSEQNNGTSGNELNKVIVDDHDNLVWIATQRGGLNRFDCKTETFTLFTNNPSDKKSIISNEITDIKNDDQGNLWISTYTSGIDYYDKKKGEFIHYNRSTLPELLSDQIWTIADDRKGNLYIGYASAGLGILSVKTGTLKNFVNQEDHPFSLPNNDIRSIFIDNIGNVWVGTKNGLALFNPESERFTRFSHNKNKPSSLIGNTVLSLNQTNDNRLWIGTEGAGISILDIRKELFLSPENISFYNIYPSDLETGLSHSTAMSIFEDNFNNVWIGTYGGGINFIKNYPDIFHKWQYTIPPVQNSLAAKAAWGMCEDLSGNQWVGTDGGGIQVFNGNQKIQSYHAEKGDLVDNAILTALRASNGDLWFGCFNNGISIYQWDKKNFTPFRSSGFDAKTIRCLFEDKYRNIWIGTDDKGLFSYNLQSKELKNYTSGNSGIPADNLIRSIASDSKGRLWVGSFGSGLNILDTAMHATQHFNAPDHFHSNTINAIFKDSREHMWIATGEGLVSFRDMDNLNDFIIYTEKDSILDSYIRAITEDEEGNIWFSTNGGISNLRVKENKIFNYNHYDGIPLGQFMNGSVLNSKNGIIYFGSQNGVCFFNPENIRTSVEMPPVTITSFRYHISDKNGLSRPNEKEYSLSVYPGSVQLNHNENTFSISFNVMNYAFSHLIEYAYQLRGMDDDWYNIGQTNEVTFRNLPPGNYVFSLKAKINNQEWSDVVASMQIRIKPPIWLSWWAKLVYSIIAGLILLYIIRFYKNRIKLKNLLFLEKQNNEQQLALNNEKLQFFTNITHELRTPLTLIIGPLEDLLKDTSFSEKSKKKINLIHQNTSRLLDLINRILDFRKTETNNMPLHVSKRDLAKLIREIGLRYKELNQNPNLQFIISIETKNTILYFDRENVNIILDNLISNAFKYTKQGSIHVTMRDVEDKNTAFTEIEISDTGCGIPEAELNKIFNRYYQVKGEYQASGTGIGLSLVKNLVKIHQGEILVDSKKGKGTSFQFRLQTNNAYPGAFHEKMDEEKAYLPDKPVYDQETPDGKGIMLIVEDNEDIRNYIWDTFIDSFMVITAENGKEGAEYAFKHVPDIIISDIMMPEVSGLEMCNIIKKDMRTSHIPVVLLTAKTSLDDKTEGYSAGADSYITKPFSADLLRSRVSNLMESRKKLATQIVNSKIYRQSILIDSMNQLDNEFIEKITKIIKENSHSDEMNIEFIAKELHISHPTLYRKIKALTGFSINEFIRKIKMKYAEELLLTGKYTISEITFRIGISSMTYFRQCFREEFGSTPSEYVKNLRKKENS